MAGGRRGRLGKFCARGAYNRRAAARSTRTLGVMFRSLHVIPLLAVAGVLAACAAQYSALEARQLCLDKKGWCSERQCAAASGIWQVAGIAGGQTGRKQCDLPASDAGKRCRDSSECSTYCVALEGSKTGDHTAGVCYYSATYFFGTYAVIDHGVVGPWLSND